VVTKINHRCHTPVKHSIQFFCQALALNLKPLH